MGRKSAQSPVKKRKREASSTSPQLGQRSLSVNRFILGRHEQESGSMLAELGFSIENPTRDTIRRVDYNAAFMDSRGFAYYGFGDDVCCSVAPGKSFELKDWSMPVAPALAGAAKYDSTVEVSAVLYALEDFKLGVVPVPDQAPASGCISRRVNSKVVDGNLRCLVVRHESDSDGQVEVECLMPIRNESDLHLLVGFGMVLLDRTGVVESSSQTLLPLPPGSLRCFTESISLPRRRFRAKDMRVRASLSVFRPVHVARGMKVSSPSVASDLRLLGDLRILGE